MSKLMLVVTTRDGAETETEINLPDPTAVLTQFAITIDGAPLILMPLYVHEDAHRYHTICSRRTPEITEMEF